MPRGRRTFCSDACVHEWKIRSNPGYVRDQVFKRDRGICARCGLDTVSLRRAISRLVPPYREHPTRDQRRADDRAWARYQACRTLTHDRDELWDADHIVPVVEGGGECGLDNYRTLCIWCHKAVTRGLAARRVLHPRPAKPRNPQIPMWLEVR